VRNDPAKAILQPAKAAVKSIPYCDYSPPTSPYPTLWLAQNLSSKQLMPTDTQSQMMHVSS